MHICPGQFYTLPSGKKVNTSGLFNDTLKFVSGCGDSLITNLNLVVNSITANNLNATICDGQSYKLPTGTLLNLEGIYYDTVYSTLGCDSIVTILNLSVTNPVLKNNNVILCQCQQYTLPSGRIVNQPGLFNDTLRTSQGCDSIITTLTLNVNPKPCAEGIFVPNAFTPNGDGHNDLLRPINLNNDPVTNFRFAIFNRWGQRIFESRDPSSGWDGRMLGTEQPAGVYVWQLEYQFPGAPLTIHSGTVVLMR
jgi:gliding motility-associated-like protein